MSDTRNTFAATVMRELPNRRFVVRVEDGKEREAVLSPGFVTKAIKVGETVRVELSPYDAAMCRIVHDDEEDGIAVRDYR